MNVTTKKYNVCLVQPSGYIHSGAFTELAELVAYTLEDLGYVSSISINQTSIDSRNIIIGAHLLDVSHIKSIKSQFPSTVILNTEQFSAINSEWKGPLFEWISNFETWDYSNQNINILRNKGINNIKCLGIGYQSRLNRITKSQNQDIDILFYGSTNDRRLKVINELKASGHNIAAIFGVYGQERDNLIARSKVVLNLHYYDSKIFEIVRVFYLMTNSKAVVGELDAETSINPIYLEGFYHSNYENLVASCNKLLIDNGMREELERKANRVIQSYPQSELMKLVLE
jgi:hypothetical protein